jgi:hypothetical protein
VKSTAAHGGNKALPKWLAGVPKGEGFGKAGFAQADIPGANDK